jgi:type I restriction enzyme S subunit
MPIRRQRELAETLRLQLALSDEAREAAQRQVTELDALFRSLYKDAFAGIVPVNIQTALGPPLPGWQWASLSEVARLESGHTPSRLRADWWGGDVSWISLTEIRKLDGCWTEETELRTNEHGIANSAARILPTGTVCYSRTASLGFVTIMGKPMATSQDFANWVCGPELDPEFLMHALIRSRVELRALATGATHKTIYMPALASFQICMPALPVQKDIVTALKHRVLAWRAMNLQARNRMSDLELLPSRLLTEAFGAI